MVPVREVGSGSEGHGDGDGEGGDGEGGQGDGGEEEVELVQLSPGVECYRKGRGPRRGRCGSYWDRDVIRVGRGGMWLPFSCFLDFSFCSEGWCRCHNIFFSDVRFRRLNLRD